MSSRKPTKILSVRVPEETAADWKAKAEAAGVTLSDWIRGQVDEKEIRGFRPRRPKPEPPKRPAPKADPELIRQVAWIGNNLNQIARKVNAAGIDDPLELLEVLLQIQTDLELIKNAH